MDVEKEIVHLKETFAKRFPYATLTITSRKIKGKTRLYFKTVGAYKIDSGNLIECYFETAYRYKQDWPNLTYYYKTD